VTGEAPGGLNEGSRSRERASASERIVFHVVQISPSALLPEHDDERRRGGRDGRSVVGI
jgi:hypothetical protein